MSDGRVYTSWAGTEVETFSFSQANEMSQCGKKFEFSRLQGWERKERQAYFPFGQCVEAAIASWINRECRENIEDLFSHFWKEYEKALLIYRKSESNWKTMDFNGRRAVRWFRLRYESGKIPSMWDCKFSENIRITGWHDSTDLLYIADAVRVKGPQVLIDIKTSQACRSDEFKKMVALDRQLRTGALVSGIRDVGFIIVAWGDKGDVEWLPATITEELVDDVDSWLKGQMGRVKRREFARDPGILFPKQTCATCEMFNLCLHGNNDGLHQRQSKLGQQLEALDG